MTISEGFILAAGLGTRLGRITTDCPKPLIPVWNRPLIFYALDQLLAAGVEKVTINIHHCHERFYEVFPSRTYKSLSLQFVHEPELLETAGGLKNAESYFSGRHIVVYNGDILSTIPLSKAIEHHLASGNEVTTVLRSKDGPLLMSMDERGRITDIRGELQSRHPPSYLLTGITILNIDFLKRVPANQCTSLIPVYLKMIVDGEKIGGVVIDDGYWWDLGTREVYLNVHSEKSALSNPAFKDHTLHAIDASAQVAATSYIDEATVIGADAIVEDNITLHNCIIWNRTRIRAGSRLTRCVVTSGADVSGSITDMTI